MKVQKSILCAVFSISVLTMASCSDDKNEVEHNIDGLSLSSSAIIIPHNGGDVPITIQSASSWKISGDLQWCLMSQTEGESYKPSTVIVSAGGNSTETPRYINLKVESGDESGNLVILQPGKNYVQPDRTGMEHTAREVVYSIHNGWNLGNTLEAIDDSKKGTGISMETAWGQPVVTKEFIDKVYEYGFNGIRIPCGWQNQLINSTNPASPDYCRIHPDWIARVKEIVDYCLIDKPDMKVYLNMHHCDWIDKKSAFLERIAKTSEIKMFKVWSQIAEAFREYDERLIFGASNEPDSQDAASAEILRRYQQAFVNAVRATGGKNTYRKLFVQAPCTNTGYALTLMKLVDDFVPGCLGIEVHFYEPILFCIGEDASWGKASYFWGKEFHQKPINGVNRNCPDNEEAIDAILSKLKEKFVDNGMPIVCGEYGAMHKDLGFSPKYQKIHDNSYVYYHKYVVSKLKENGLVPFLWDTGGTINHATMGIDNPLIYSAIVEGANTDYPY